MDKLWGDNDHDIWVDVPSSLTLPTARATSPAVLPKRLVSRATPRRGGEHPFLRVASEHVFVGDVRLPRRRAPHPLAPPMQSVRHVCIDQTTAELLHHVATSIALRDPTALEGDTATAKTTAFLVLAAQTGHGLIRLNLSGQTDVSDLLMMYEPSPNEHGTGTVWKHREGPVVSAVREGHWLLLDELNLAAAAVIEALNPLVERHPTLRVNDSVVFGANAEPVHDGFRLFATLNSVDRYAGRNEMSPAGRDRWTAYRFVGPASEDDLFQMMRYWRTGQQPPVQVDGTWYAGSKSEPLLDIPEALSDETLRRFARFHASVVASTSNRNEGRALGKSRREPYVFTRRGIHAAFAFIAEDVKGGADAHRALLRAIHRYYTLRVEREDQSVVAHILDASGIA